MPFISLKEYVERHKVAIIECAYCGRPLSEVEAVWIGCCPLCRDCYRGLMR